MQKENLRADEEKWHIIFRRTITTLTSKKKQWKLEDNGTRFCYDWKKNPVNTEVYIQQK